MVPVTIAIAVAGVAWPKAQSPLFVWNVSQSVPVGLYVIIARPPSRGEFAALRLPEPMRRLADEHGYLPASAVLIKPVAAQDGDIVCRSGAMITINGQAAARAWSVDTSGWPLPQWTGCHDIDARRFLVLSDEPNSFDGRYFGPIDARQIIGTTAAVTVDSVLALARSRW